MARSARLRRNGILYQTPDVVRRSATLSIISAGDRVRRQTVRTVAWIADLFIIANDYHC
jgi:hypothetical protein